MSNRGKGEIMENEKLIEKAKKGDKKAFLSLIELEQSKLYQQLFFIPKIKMTHLILCKRPFIRHLIRLTILKKQSIFPHG